jgi:hypothetical protein
MISAMIDMMIGPIGRALRDFYFEYQTIINIVFVLWAGVITYASIQLHSIRKLTISLSVKFIKDRPHLSDEETWRAFKPSWQEAIAQLNPRLIQNRWNFWVTKATPENIIYIMKLGPEWFAALKQGEVLRYRFSIPGKNLDLSMFTKEKPPRNSKTK